MTRNLKRAGAFAAAALTAVSLSVAGDATDLLGDLWTVPAYLRRCAPWLAPDEVVVHGRRSPVGALELRLPHVARVEFEEGERTRAQQRFGLVAELPKVQQPVCA